MNFIRNKKNDRKNFLDSIDYLTETELNDNTPSIDKLKRVSPLLNEYNPMTYAILLNHHNIKQEDRDYYQNVLHKLLQREKTIVEETLKLFEPKNEENNINYSSSVVYDA